VVNGLPVINRRIALRAHSGAEFASRVEDVGDDWLTVARPLDLPPGERPRVGTEFTTTWQAENGIFGLTCRLAGVHRQGIVPLWDMDVVGRGWREQRRAYVRASVCGTARMKWAGEKGDERVVGGALIDLSEAGLRYVCRDADLAAHALVGSEVEVSFQTGGKEFELAASVLRVARSEVRTWHTGATPWEIVTLFTDPGRAADDLRRIVFDQQLRARNGHNPRRAG
jgi:c-di-GMP-binding flagellar brake protein YcgR